MAEAKRIVRSSFIQRSAVPLALFVFVLAIGAYSIKFAGWWNFSDSPETWGQLGDYLGGVINPIVGLITICLLVSNLRQNQVALTQSREALEQASEEIKLTRDALEQAKAVQEATEVSLRDQVKIAQEAKDMNNVIALWSGLVSRESALEGIIRGISGNYYGGEENNPQKPYKDKLTLVRSQIVELDQLKNAEIHRLVELLKRT